MTVTKTTWVETWGETGRRGPLVLPTKPLTSGLDGLGSQGLGRTRGRRLGGPVDPPRGVPTVWRQGPDTTGTKRTSARIVTCQATWPKLDQTVVTISVPLVYHIRFTFLLIFVGLGVQGRKMTNHSELTRVWDLLRRGFTIRSPFPDIVVCNSLPSTRKVTQIFISSDRILLFLQTTCVFCPPEPSVCLLWRDSLLGGVCARNGRWRRVSKSTRVEGLRQQPVVRIQTQPRREIKGIVKDWGRDLCSILGEATGGGKEGLGPQQRSRNVSRTRLDGRTDEVARGKTVRTPIVSGPCSVSLNGGPTRPCGSSHVPSLHVCVVLSVRVSGRQDTTCV